MPGDLGFPFFSFHLSRPTSRIALPLSIFFSLFSYRYSSVKPDSVKIPFPTTYYYQLEYKPSWQWLGDEFYGWQYLFPYYFPDLASQIRRLMVSWYPSIMNQFSSNLIRSIGLSRRGNPLGRKPFNVEVVSITQTQPDLIDPALKGMFPGYSEFSWLQLKISSDTGRTGIFFTKIYTIPNAGIMIIPVQFLTSMLKFGAIDTARVCLEAWNSGKLWQNQGPGEITQIAVLNLPDDSGKWARIIDARGPSVAEQDENSPSWWIVFIEPESALYSSIQKGFIDQLVTKICEIAGDELFDGRYYAEIDLYAPNPEALRTQRFKSIVYKFQALPPEDCLSLAS